MRNLTIKKHQNDIMKEKQSSEGLEDKTKFVDSSRRRFTKAGLAATGVILTLASRPVLANTDCKSPSAWASANMSAHFKHNEMCFGNYPDYYANNPQAWGGTQYLPGTYNDNKENSNSKGSSNSNGNPSSTNNVDNWVGGTQFQQAFPGSRRYPGKSMMQVLWMGRPMDVYLCAALLNAALGLTPPLTETRIVDMCLEYETKGYFEPTAGVHWFEGDIIFYLENLA
jgi:hypothetical protein